MKVAVVRFSTVYPPLRSGPGRAINPSWRRPGGLEACSAQPRLPRSPPLSGPLPRGRPGAGKSPYHELRGLPGCGPV
jgi:hypothetical protein